jgi:hypothetical protein
VPLDSFNVSFPFVSDDFLALSSCCCLRFHLTPMSLLLKQESSKFLEIRILIFTTMQILKMVTCLFLHQNQLNLELEIH